MKKLLTLTALVAGVALFAGCMNQPVEEPIVDEVVIEDVVVEETPVVVEEVTEEVMPEATAE